MPRECWVAEDRRRLPTEDATKQGLVGGPNSGLDEIWKELEIGEMVVENEGVGSGM